MRYVRIHIGYSTDTSRYERIRLYSLHAAAHSRSRRLAGSSAALFARLTGLGAGWAGLIRLGTVRILVLALLLALVLRRIFGRIGRHGRRNDIGIAAIVVPIALLRVGVGDGLTCRDSGEELVLVVLLDDLKWFSSPLAST